MLLCPNEFLVDGHCPYSNLYQNSKTLTHATYAATGTSIAKTYGSPMGYGRLARARTVAEMSQCLRSLVLANNLFAFSGDNRRPIISSGLAPCFLATFRLACARLNTDG